MSKNVTLTGGIEITKLICVRTTRKGKNGQDIDGFFIPKDLNHFEEIVKKEDGKEVPTGRFKLNVRVIYTPEADEKYGQNGFIAKSLPSEIYKANKEDKEFLSKSQPILGNIKDWANQSVDDMPPPPEAGEDDDLPW